MSIFISDFSDPWTVTHDDAPGGAHTGTVDPASVTFIQNMDGTSNHNFVSLTCPVCGASSTHPVGGGAQPPLVQEMFARIAQRDGCPCPADYASGLPLQLTLGHTKQHVMQMDGPDRWQVGADVI